MKPILTDNKIEHCIPLHLRQHGHLLTEKRGRLGVEGGGEERREVKTERKEKAEMR